MDDYLSQYNINTQQIIYKYQSWSAWFENYNFGGDLNACSQFSIHNFVMSSCCFGFKNKLFLCQKPVLGTK